MLSIFYKELKSRWKSTTIWFLSLFALVLILVWAYGSVGNIDYEELVKQYPPEFEAFFGDFRLLSTPAGYLGAEFYNSIYPIMLAILGIIIGSGIVAKEEDSGTLELLLASPISRFSILLQKALVLVKIIGLVGLSSIIGIVMGKIFFDFDITLIDPFLATLAGIFLGSAFGLFALMVTALSSRRGLTVGVSTVLLVASYFASTLPALIEELEPFKYFSLFYYYDSQNVLQGQTNWWYLLLLIMVSMIFFIIGYLGFKNRDVGT